MSANSKGGIMQPLNPADYFTLAMDDEIRRDNLSGSLCVFALELDRRPDIESLVHRIEEFTRKFPLSLASLQAQGKKFYWCKRIKPEPVFFQHRCPETESNDIFQRTTIDSLINRHEARESTLPIEFHLISGANTHCFLIRWLHPFCDARGIEIILKFLCTDDPAQRELFDTPVSAALVGIQLSKFKWWQKIQLFYKAYSHVHKIDQYQSIQHGKTEQTPKKIVASTFKFSEAETVLIGQEARKLCGLTGTSLYYIGCLMRALEHLNPDQSGDAYCTPYAFNLRKQNALSPVLGNHIGTLFAQAPKSIILKREELFKHLKNQNTQAIRQQLDYAFLPVMWAASHLPLKKYGAELRRSYKNDSERSSFWFSDIGQINFEPYSFFKADINGLFHLSQMSSPPGLALLCCHYRKQLTLSYNFVEPLFSEYWISRLHSRMTEELLGQTA